MKYTREEISLMLQHLSEENVEKVYHYVNSLQGREKEKNKNREEGPGRGPGRSS